MRISLKDLGLAKRAMRAKCRLHSDEPAATCRTCAMLAERQMEVQWKREREAAHQEYLAKEAAR